MGRGLGHTRPLITLAIIIITTTTTIIIIHSLSQRNSSLTNISSDNSGLRRHVSTLNIFPLILLGSSSDKFPALVSDPD